MLNHLVLFMDTRDPEDLHKMRVEIKKIYAGLRLAGVSLKSKRIKPLKELFKTAGVVRDTYVRLGLIGLYCPENDSFKNEQNIRLINRSEEFSLKITGYVKQNIYLFKTIAKQLHNIKDKRLLRWYRRQIKELAIMLAGYCKEENLHLSRKKIKNMLYDYALVQERLEKKLHLSTPYLDQLQEKVGNWHDSVMTIEFLSSEGTVNKQVIKKLRMLNTKLLHAAISFSDDFIQKAVTIPG